MWFLVFYVFKIEIDFFLDKYLFVAFDFGRVNIVQTKLEVDCVLILKETAVLKVDNVFAQKQVEVVLVDFLQIALSVARVESYTLFVFVFACKFKQWVSL